MFLWMAIVYLHHWHSSWTDQQPQVAIIRTEVVQYLESHTEMVSLWYSQRFSRRLYGVLIITSAKGVMFSPAFHRMFVEL